MPFTLKIEAKAWQDGPQCPTVEVPNFPLNIEEAISMYGREKVYADFLRNFVIPVQAKMRAAYKGKSIGTKTKKGSAVSQAREASALDRRRAILAASEVANRLEAAKQSDEAETLKADEQPEMFEEFEENTEE